MTTQELALKLKECEDQLDMLLVVSKMAHVRSQELTKQWKELNELAKVKTGHFTPNEIIRGKV